MPPNTVNVTRPGKYGNTWKVGTIFFNEDGTSTYGSPEVVTKKFRDHMVWFATNWPNEFKEYIAPLKGIHLACWCKPGESCHGDVLLEIANNDDWVNNPK